MKGYYKHQYQKHEIHSVTNNEITVQKVNIAEFAVNLKISTESIPKNTFRDEARQHFLKLKEFKSDDKFDVSNLIGKEHRVTFVRGIAGMGKSVLAKRITYGWAEGKIYNEFKLLIMFECRELNEFVADKGSKLMKDNILTEFLKTKTSCELDNGEGILFIVDGLDELYDIDSDDSLIWQLLDCNRSVCNRSKIILLGRPHIEENLDNNDSKMGNLRKVEILGLTNNQIEEYIRKFSKNQESAPVIAKDSLGRYLPILHIPQFLNTYHCAAKLTTVGKIRNSAELYCWTIYLLFKQHASRQHSNGNQTCKIFEENTHLLLSLSKVCYEMLAENKIILDNIQSLFHDTRVNKKFISSLFVPTTDASKKKRYQFKHLSLMEFLSALHICNIEDAMNIVIDHLESGWIEVVSFFCRLISGYSYKGIIKDMLTSVKIVPKYQAKDMLPDILKTLRETWLSEKTVFERSIQIIVDILNDKSVDTEFLLNIISKLHCWNFYSNRTDSTNLTEICHHLEIQCNCDENKIQEVFNKVSFEMFTVNEVGHLNTVKYFNISTIKLQGIKIESDSLLKLEMAFRKERKVHVTDCEINDEEKGRQKAENRESLNELIIRQCKLTHQSFITICGWGVSTVKFELRKLNIEAGWWRDLVETVTSQKGCENLQLKRLVIRDCATRMSEEQEDTVRDFITHLLLAYKYQITTAIFIHSKIKHINEN